MPIHKKLLYCLCIRPFPFKLIIISYMHILYCVKDLFPSKIKVVAPTRIPEHGVKVALIFLDKLQGVFGANALDASWIIICSYQYRERNQLVLGYSQSIKVLLQVYHLWLYC